MENILLSFGFINTAKNEYKNGRYTAIYHKLGCSITTYTPKGRILDETTYSSTETLKKRLLNAFN